MPSARPRFPWRGAFVVLGAWLAVGFAPETAGAAPRRFGVTEEGAVADGQTLNTVAIQTAVDRAESSGRGVVEIPAGTLLSGSIFLKRGVELWLAEGAVRLGSTNIEDDPKRETRSEGHFEPGRMALVNAPGLTRVRIGGKGPINGNGVPSWQAFWARRKENPKCTHLEVERPRLLFVDNGREGRIEGLALQDAGFWMLPLDHCRDALIEGRRITLPSAVNGLRGPSTDGIDGGSCQNVTIRRCAMATQDDTIALKGSKGPLADQDGPSPPVENITVEDCEYGDGNGLITCGSEATLVRNVTVRHCTLSDRATLLTRKLRPDTPPRDERITFDGITLTGGGGGGRLLNVAPWTQFFDLKGQPAPSRIVSDVTLRHVRGEFRSMGTLRGNPGDGRRDLTLENIDLKLADETLALGPPENLVVKNGTVNGKPFVLPAPPSH